jgi:hypothetical protein
MVIGGFYFFHAFHAMKRVQFLVVTGVMVAPVPILPLLCGRQRAKFAVRSVSLHSPPAVEDDLIVVPHVVVTIVGIVNQDGGVFRASGNEDGRSNRDGH